MHLFSSDVCVYVIWVLFFRHVNVYFYILKNCWYKFDRLKVVFVS